MSAYNPEHLAAERIRAAAEEEDFLTDAERAAVLDAYPPALYTPNTFIRVGLWLATLAIGIFGAGLIMLMAEFSGKSYVYIAFFCAFVSYGALELLVKEKRHCRSGVDDGLAWLCAIFLLFGIIVNDFHSDTEFIVSITAMLLGTLLAWRFINIIAALFAFGGLAMFIFYGFIHIPFAVPFLLLAASVAVYFGGRRLERNADYAYMGQWLQAAALAFGYYSVNYFVVDEMMSEALSLKINAGWLFWTFTMALPPLYIWAGLRWKDRILLRIGIVLVALSAMTFRNYHAVMPMEWALILSGAALIVVAWGVHRYLRTPRHGWTVEPDDRPQQGAAIVESLVIAQTLGKTEAPAEGFEFRGGSGGGGGASGQY
ncbi:hypothetical protein ACWKWU_00080 [Chitinophaga lutea]